MQQVSLREYCEEARSFIRSGAPQKAILITRHILRHYPRHLESYRLLGQALQAAGDYRQAVNQFQRVLSADPEDVTARIGMAEAHAATGDLDKAIQHMQRALELSPEDAELHSRLDQLINAYQPSNAPQSLELTRAALGRIHARGGLYTKAIQEFKAVLAYDPDRLDVQTALAEALWRAGHYLEAGEVSHDILARLPNALKANLILGTAWLTNAQPAEAQPYLDTAQALDPENVTAQSLFGEKSPLPLVRVTVQRLGEDEIEDIQLRPPPELLAEEVLILAQPQPTTEWMSELREEEAMPTNDVERPEEEFELPDWLEGLGDDLLEEKDEQPAPVGPSELDSDAGDEMPGWLRNLVERTQDVGAAPESVPAEPGELPDWLHELRPEAAETPAASTGTPDWLASMAAEQPPDFLQAEPTLPLEELAEPAAPGTFQADWLTETETPGEWFTSVEAAEEPVIHAEEGRALWEQISAEEPAEMPIPPIAEQPPPELQVPTPPLAEADIPTWPKEFGEGEALLEAQVEQPEAPIPTDKLKPSLLEPVSGVVEEWDVPDWLREIAAGETAPSQEPQPTAIPTSAIPEVEVDQAGLPDWLREIEEPTLEEAPPAVLFEPREVTGEPAIPSEEGRALWEQILAEEGLDLASVQEVRPPEAAGMTPEEWLRSTADLERRPSAPQAEQPPVEVPEAPSLAQAETEAEQIGPPAWLTDIGKSWEEEAEPAAGVSAEAPPTPVWQQETAEPAPTSAPSFQAGLPDWLRKIIAGKPTAEEGEPVAPTPQAEVPDWLRQVEKPEAEEQPPAPVEVAPELTTEAIREPQEAVEAEVEEAELPDWLREPVAETIEGPEYATEPSTGMPEWLAELETEEVFLAESDLEEPAELETGEMPEWLGEIMAGEPPLAEEWPPMPDIAELPEAEALAEPIPDWLRDYREREWEAPAEVAPETIEPEAEPQAEVAPEYAPQPELPDWLIRLREGVPEEAETAVSAVEMTPAEAFQEEVALPAIEELVEPEVIQPEAVGPAWLGELVRAEESLAEFEAVIEEEPGLVEEVTLAPEVYREPVAVEAEPEPFATAPAERVPSTRELEALRIEDLPKDPAVRLSMARAALNADDWAEALTIYRALVTSSEMLDSVIDNLQVGLRRHPDDVAGYELLGDACMKEGRLQEALQAYRTALSKL